MKLFQCVEKFYGVIGIQPIASDHNVPLNLKNLFVLFCTVHLFVSSTAFFLFEAETVAVMSDSFYTSISTMSFILNSFIFIWNFPQIRKLIEKFEQFIEQSEFKSIVSRLIFHLMAKEVVNSFHFRIDKSGFRC